MKRIIITTCTTLLLIAPLAWAQHGGPITTANPSTWWSNTGRLAPGAIGDTTPSRGTFSPSISKGPAIITSFAGTISSSGATVTFSAAADAVLAGYLATNTSSGLGTTLIAAAQTRYIIAWLSSTQCTVSSAPSPAWGAGTAITSAQLPIATFVSSTGAVAGWVLADKSVYLLGNVGIGTTGPGSPLTVNSNANQLRLETYSEPANYYATLASLYDSAHPFSLLVNGGTGILERMGVYAEGGGGNPRVAFMNGNVGIGTTTPDDQFAQSGSYGSQYVRRSYSASANIAAAATATVQVNVPAGVRILSSACQVSSALAAGDLWDLELNDGGTVSALATGLAVALNTADYDMLSGVVTDAETDLVVTKNGVGNFTAQGTIRCTVWGEYQTVLTAN